MICRLFTFIPFHLIYPLFLWQVDVIASVPIELVTSALHNVSNSSSTTTSTSGPRGSEAAALAKAMRVPKLLRLLRMVHYMRINAVPCYVRTYTWRWRAPCMCGDGCMLLNMKVRLVRAGPLRRRLTYFFYYSNHANTLKVFLSFKYYQFMYQTFV